jgi:DNA-binding NarL/FixJ family response regulator
MIFDRSSSAQVTGTEAFVLPAHPLQFGVEFWKGRGVGSMSGMRQARILVVDDVAAWREQIRSLLKAHAEWTVIGEAADGKEAIQKAAELGPDIILLDIGMPALNGIEAAKIIRQTCPKSKILFVTQDGDHDIRDEAMRAGALGYVLKTNAAHELVNAISTALHPD